MGRLGLLDFGISLSSGLVSDDLIGLVTLGAGLGLGLLERAGLISGTAGFSSDSGILASFGLLLLVYRLGFDTGGRN